MTVCSLFFIGLFNICNKILIGIDILLEWRELFKEGFPLTNVITAKIKSLMMKVEEVNMKSNIGIIKRPKSQNRSFAADFHLKSSVTETNQSRGIQKYTFSESSLQDLLKN